MVTPVKATTYLMRLGEVEVQGEYYFYRGARDGKFGPPLEPDEEGVEVTDVIRDGQSILDSLTDAEFDHCSTALWEREAGIDDEPDYPDLDD